MILNMIINWELSVKQLFKFHEEVRENKEKDLADFKSLLIYLLVSSK